MQNIKSHKTVEQIAKKHRLDVSFVKKQLEMGIPIEHEHTKDKDLATDIALQHLDEIPDYYTRLKKMEASARKSHKKYKDVTESKKGLWDNIHARREKGLPPKKPGEKGYPKTLDIEEGLKRARKNVGASKCWSGKKVGNPPTKIKGGKEVPNCVPIKEGMGGIRYCPKCQKDETRDECRYGQKYWDLFSVPPSLSSGNHYDANSPHPGNFPESYDHEYSMARSEISTIISAAKRLKKKMGKGEGNIEAWVQSKITKAADYLDAAADYVDSGEMKEESESLVLQDLNGNDFVEIIDVIKPLPIRVKKEQFSNWRKELVEDGQQLDELWGKVALTAGAAALPYLMKKLGEKPVNDALDKARKTSPIGGERRVPQMNSYESQGDVVEDWQSVNRKDKTDGLSPAAVKAYRRENPGSKLQTAVTEKNPEGKRADRRSNFCSRMSGMKDKLTSAKTARDPDSRINKALRRWRCN